MQILNSKYSIKPENYNKRTPAILKKIADMLLASVLVVNPVIIAIPEFEGREWFIWGWNMLVVLFKLVTKTITEELDNVSTT